MAEASRPFTGSNVQATLRDLEGRMREAASNLAFEEACRLRDDPQGSAKPEIKRMKLLDLAFANAVMTGAGEEVDRSAPKRWRKEAQAEAQAEAQERFRKGRLSVLSPPCHAAIGKPPPKGWMGGGRQ